MKLQSSPKATQLISSRARSEQRQLSARTPGLHYLAVLPLAFLASFMSSREWGLLLHVYIQHGTWQGGGWAEVGWGRSLMAYVGSARVPGLAVGGEAWCPWPHPRPSHHLAGPRMERVVLSEYWKAFVG